jgi:hypothetical protein
MKKIINQKKSGFLALFLFSVFFSLVNSCNHSGKSKGTDDTITAEDTSKEPTNNLVTDSKLSFFSVILSVDAQRTLFQSGSQTPNEVKMIEFEFDPSVTGGFGLRAVGLDKNAMDVAGTEVSLSVDRTGLMQPNPGGGVIPPDYFQSITRGQLKHLLNLPARDEPITNFVELRLSPCMDAATGRIYYVITNTANPTTVCPDPRPANAVGRVGSNPSPPDGQPCLEDCDTRTFMFKTNW